MAKTWSGWETDKMRLKRLILWEHKQVTKEDQHHVRRRKADDP